MCVLGFLIFVISFLFFSISRFHGSNPVPTASPSDLEMRVKIFCMGNIISVHGKIKLRISFIFGKL